MAIAIVALALLAPEMRLLPMLGLALSVAVAVLSFVPLVGRNLRRTPLPVYGMVIAHFGIAVALAGMATESSFIKERLTAVSVGQSATVGDWRVTLSDVKPVVGPNWTALEGVLLVQRRGEPHIMRPQARAFTQPPTETNEAALLTTWDGQLYAVMGQSAGDGRWQLRLWWKPLVWWIWAGGSLIALGGLLALIGRINPTHLWRRWRSARESRKYPNGRYAA
jgi:cytochrome c-type biogenesis protein CcmF